jgi:hypothetical protein
LGIEFTNTIVRPSEKSARVENKYTEAAELDLPKNEKVVDGGVLFLCFSG